MLQVLLVDGELFGDFWAWLSGQEVLEFDVELFFLLDGHVLLDDLLSLLDETLLQGLDLVEELPRIWVGSLELPPPVVVQWVLELLGEGLDLEALLLKSVGEAEDFLPEVVDLRGLALLDSQLTLQITDLELEQLDVLETLQVLDFTLGKRDLEDLDLLVQESQLVVSADELSSKDVPLDDGSLMLLVG